MAQVICARSGLVFECQFLPMSLKRGETSHPFFSFSRRQLLGLAGRWSNGDLSPEETYLYYLALFDSSGLIIWRHPAQFTPDTMSIIAGTMERLIRVIAKMDVHHTHIRHLPQFTVNYDTASLLHCRYWIDAWQSTIREVIQGYKTAADIYTEQQRELAIERLIKSPYRMSNISLAKQIADWAEVAGKFPTFLTPAPSGKEIPCNELWKEIIRACVDDDRVIHIPVEDLEELTDHVIENIPQGTIHAHQLLTFLREAKRKKIDFTSLGFDNENLAGKTTSFTIVHTQAQKTNATLQAIAAQAPSKEPLRKDFASLADFLRAKSRWTLAQNMSGSQAAATIGQTKMSSEVSDMLAAQQMEPEDFPETDELYGDE